MSTTVRSIGFGRSSHTFKTLESGVRSYCRSMPAVFTCASGSEIFDAEGEAYLDFLSGAGSLNYGHNHPVLRDALANYIANDGITHSLDFYTAAKQEFLESFQKYILEPRSLDYVQQFTGPTGTNAVEAALKLARKITGREGIVSFTNAFHGVSLGALALTGNEHHRGAAGVSMPGALRAPYAGYLENEANSLDYLDKVLEDSSSGFGYPAAVIVETVQGEGGLNVASPEWLQRLAKICADRQILLIVDDIQAGCGRTADYFSFERAGIKPDMVTLSKSLSGYGLPFAVVLLKPDLDTWSPGEHNGTFRGNNHAFVTATAAIEQFWRTPIFSHDVRRKASLLRSHLDAIAADSELDLTVKGLGMMVGLECEDGETAARICKAARDRNMILETSGSNDQVVKCMPPLTISDADLERGAAILAASVGAAQS